MSINITADTISIISVVASILTVVLTGIYVVLTRKTFLEIKKQTDNQIRAYLLVGIKEGIKEENNLFQKIRKSWDETVRNNISDVVSVDKSICLELSNRGKTDICEWEIELTLKIEVGKYLESKHLKGDSLTIKINSHTSEDFIKQGEKKLVPIGSLGLIPHLDMKWRIDYKDLHDVKYNHFSGDNNFSHRNNLIYDYRV